MEIGAKSKRANATHFFNNNMTPIPISRTPTTEGEGKVKRI
jgi:hypothetical protein